MLISVSDVIPRVDCHRQIRYSSMKIKVFFPDPRSESSNILKDEINTDFHRFASTAVNFGKVPRYAL